MRLLMTASRVLSLIYPAADASGTPAQRHPLVLRAGVVAVLVALVVLVALAAPAFAQDGGTASTFKLGAGSRGIGLGGAFVSLADDASSVYWNPATLRNVGSMQFTAMYMPLYGEFTGAGYTYFGFVYPTLSAGAFGVGFMSVGTTFDLYDEASRPGGEGNASESQFLVSYAAERHFGWLLGSLATGASFKISRQQVDPFSSTSPGVDIGFRYIPDAAKSLSLGVNLQDIVGAQYKLDLEEDQVDRTILAGAGYTKKFTNGSALRLMLQYDLPERADGRFHAGAEYMFSRLIALRAGLDDGTATFGLGVGAFNYGLDYAFYSKDEAGSNQAVTFSGRFGQTLDEKREAIEAQRAEDERALIQRTFETRIATHREKARTLEAGGDWAGALNQWLIVLEYVPDDTEAVAARDAAREQVLAQQAAAVRDLGNQALIRTRFARGLDLFNENDLVGARTEWVAILAIDSLNAGARDYLDQTDAKIDERIRAHSERAQQLERDGRLTEAIAEWNNVQQYQPDNASARASVARIRKQIESVSQDYAASQRKLRIVTLYNDALTEYNAGRYQDAMNHLRELLTLQPDHADAKKLMALTKRRTTPLTGAEKARVRELYLAGMQFFSKDQYAQAIAEWEKILEIDPTNESVQRSIEEARERLRKVEGQR
jgi:tetratricopeptide (TPR) repeat protein